MQQARLVGVIERVKDGDDDRERTLRRERSGALEQLAERHAVDERHGIVGESFAFTDEVDRQDVGVLELGRRAGLPLEALERAGGPGDVRPQHLHGEPAL